MSQVNEAEQVARVISQACGAEISPTDPMVGQTLYLRQYVEDGCKSLVETGDTLKKDQLTFTSTLTNAIKERSSSIRTICIGSLILNVLQFILLIIVAINLPS